MDRRAASIHFPQFPESGLIAGMQRFGPTTYGDRIADEYDRLVTMNPSVAPGEAVAERLARFVAGTTERRALELAIGTGRVALPLAARGVEVHGIDASEAMVAKLRAKPGGDRLAVTMGDFADVGVDGRYPLIFLVFNTFFALLTEADQRRCLTNVASHLTDGGVFVVEAFVFDDSFYERDQRVWVTHVGLDEVKLDVARHHPEAQRIDAQQILITERGIRLFPVNLRYVHADQLDEMAADAGLRLRERHGGWDDEPLTDASRSHVSVYEGA
jgi:SAM-dependent methyltransferase